MIAEAQRLTSTCSISRGFARCHWIKALRSLTNTFRLWVKSHLAEKWALLGRLRASCQRLTVWMDNLSLQLGSADCQTTLLFYGIPFAKSKVIFGFLLILLILPRLRVTFGWQRVWRSHLYSIWDGAPALLAIDSDTILAAQALWFGCSDASFRSLRLSNSETSLTHRFSLKLRWTSQSFWSVLWSNWLIDLQEHRWTKP